MGILRIFKKKEEPVVDPLVNYIVKCRELGFSEEKIIEGFREKGYDEGQIKEVFEKLPVEKQLAPEILEAPEKLAEPKKISREERENYEFNKIPRKRRKRALQLLEEYKKGLVIKIDSEINQKEVIQSLRKEL